MKTTNYGQHKSHVLLALAVIALSASASAQYVDSGQIRTQPSYLSNGGGSVIIAADKKQGLRVSKKGLSSYKSDCAGYASTGNTRWKAMLGKDEAKK